MKIAQTSAGPPSLTISDLSCFRFLLHMAYYNFCWRHGALRVTSAMAVGVTRELWSLERLIDEVRM